MRRLFEIVATAVAVMVSVSAAQSCRSAESRAERLEDELAELRELLQDDRGVRRVESSATEHDRVLEDGVRTFLQHQASDLDVIARAGGEESVAAAETRTAAQRSLADAATRAQKWQPVFLALGDLAMRIATLDSDAMEDDDFSTELRVLREEIHDGVSGIAPDLEPRP